MIPGFAPNRQWAAGKEGKFEGLVAYLRKLHEEKGLNSVMLFGVVEDKDGCGSMGDFVGNRDSGDLCKPVEEQKEVSKSGKPPRPSGDPTPVINCMRALQKALPDLQLMADVCLCEYTDHGHCGILRKVPGQGESQNLKEAETIINNGETLKRLVSCALAYCAAGAHWVCPSDMMDGRVQALRTALDGNGEGNDYN
jgi:delta-aminolevulinic acid dehydratase/porphobilinogen synthase